MLAWACDLIVASDDAEFCDPVVTMGVCGVEWFVHPFELGPRKAKELLFTADAGAPRRRNASAWSTTWCRAPSCRLRAGAGGKIAAKPAFALKLTKEAVNRSMDVMGQPTAIEQAFALHHLCHAHNLQEFGMVVDPAGLHPPRGRRVRRSELDVDLTYSEEQALLRDSARRFLTDRYPRRPPAPDGDDPLSDRRNLARVRRVGLARTAAAGGVWRTEPGHGRDRDPDGSVRWQPGDGALRADSGAGRRGDRRSRIAGAAACLLPRGSGRDTARASPMWSAPPLHPGPRRDQGAARRQRLHARRPKDVRARWRRRGLLRDLRSNVGRLGMHRYRPLSPAARTNGLLVERHATLDGTGTASHADRCIGRRRPARPQR